MKIKVKPSILSIIVLAVIALVIALGPTWAQEASPTPCCPPCGAAGKLCSGNVLFECTTAPDGSCPPHTQTDCGSPGCNPGYYCDAYCAMPTPTPTPPPPCLSCLWEDVVETHDCVINGYRYPGLATVRKCTDLNKPCCDELHTGICNGVLGHLPCEYGGLTGYTYHEYGVDCTCQ